MSFPRYPKYKPSGVEWLGEVPEGWEVVPLRHWCECLDRIRVPLNATERAARAGNVPYWGANSILDHVDQALIDEVVVLLGEDGAPFFDKAKPVAFLVRGPIWPNNHVHVLRPSNTQSAEFLAHALNATDYSAYVEGSTRDKLTQLAMMRIRLPKPPLPEQRAIAAFLDRETGKIDALVAEQERLIELLKEKRQAVISHAVTKGLNPKAPMKDSGIEWLGEVPAHWEVGPVKRFVIQRSGAIKTGPFGSQLTASDMTEGAIKVYTQRTVIDSDFDSGENFISDAKFSELTKFEVFPGDVLVTTRGTIGRAVTVPPSAQRGILHPCLLRVQPEPQRLDAEFLVALIEQSSLVRQQIGYLSNATTIEVVYSDTMGSVIIPVPPIAEQQAILKWLSRSVGDIDALLTEAQRAIELLQERRSALISAAVTGQIDVRKLGERAA